MSQRTSQRRVQQKLAYANQCIQLIANAESPLAAEALQEAAIGHLMGAYSALLSELSQQAQITVGQDFSSAVAVSGSLSGHSPAFLSECLEKERSEGWLANLQQANAYCLRLGEAVTKPNNLLALKNVDDGLPDSSTLLDWHGQLSDLALHLRELNVEY